MMPSAAAAPLPALLLEVELGPDDASAETLALTLVSQTSVGITIANSRSTRSQSKRLWARLDTVCSRVC